MSDPNLLYIPYLLIYQPKSYRSGIDFKFLEQHDIEIKYAENKKDMIQMMRNREAAAVIAFSESEDNNAIDFLRYLMRQHQNTQRIYLTERLDKKLIENVINKAHANYLLVLPLELKVLEEVVNKAFKRHNVLTQPQRRYNDLAGITADLLENVNKYRSEASTDPLTRLFNRRSFDKVLDHAVGLFHDKNIPFSLIMIDLDDFKKINDTYGHSVGDKVLQSFAKILQKTLRQEDSAFRYGGEEFAVIVSGNITKNIKQLVYRVRNQVLKNSVYVEKNEIKYTFSAGFSVMKKEISGSDLVEAADAALYHAKRHGKNRVVLFKQSMLQVN